MADRTDFAAKSAHSRIGWCFEVLKVGDESELHVFKRKHNGDIEIYSPSGSRAGSKVAFGKIVKCEFLNGLNSRTKTTTSIFQLTNEDNRKGTFDIQLLDMFLKEQNAFTAKCGQLIIDKKYKLVAMYLSLLVRSKSFSNHNQDIFDNHGFSKKKDGLQLEDLREHSGSLEEYTEFVKLAEETASLSNKPSQPKKRKITEFFPPKEPKKLTKLETIEKNFKDELQNEIGVEKMHSVAYEGRADIPISQLSVSPLLGLPVNQAKVSSIQASMKQRFNPAKATLTVSPVDGSRVDLENIKDQKFYVIHGIHSFLAMQNLHAQGLFSTLTGVQNDCVLSFVVNLANKPAGHNYCNMRDNEIDSKHQTVPSVHMLIYIFKRLKKEYKETQQATEAIESIAKLMKIPAEDLIAVRKICSWPYSAVEHLVAALVKYEKYGTQDAYEQKSKGSMKSGMPLKVTKAMFRLIGKCSPDYFEDNVENVLTNKISLKTLLDGANKFCSMEKTSTSLLQICKYKEIGALNLQFPGKFTPDVLEKYAGAQVVGKNKNVQGALLESYYKSVVEKKGDEKEPIKVEAYESILEVGGDMLETNNLVVLKMKNLNQDYLQYVIDSVGTSRKETFAVLILTRDGTEQIRVLAMLKDWQENEGFSVKQLFFEKDDSAKGKYGFDENLGFSVLCGKVQIHGQSIPVLMADVKNSLSGLLSQLCPLGGKIAVVTGPDTAVPFIHHGADSSWSNVTYYGDKIAVTKLKKRFQTEKVGEKVGFEQDGTVVVRDEVNVTDGQEEQMLTKDQDDQKVLEEQSDDGAEVDVSIYNFDADDSDSHLTRQSSTSKC